MPKPSAWTTPTPRRDQALNSVLHFDGHLDGTQGWLCALHWRVDEHHQPVGREAGQRGLVACDDRAESLIVVAQDLHNVLGLGVRRERCKATQITENSDDFRPLAGKHALVTGVLHKLRDLRCEKALQAA